MSYPYIMRTHRRCDSCSKVFGLARSLRIKLFPRASNHEHAASCVDLTSLKLLALNDWFKVMYSRS